MLYDTVNLNQFERAFYECGRGGQFSQEALHALFEYLDNFDVDVELDPIGFCCDFAELSQEDLLQELDSDDVDDVNRYIRDNHDVIKKLSNGNYLIQNQ